MARRSGRTPLYEYMNTGRSTPAPADRAGRSPERAANASTTPSAVRVPVGYIFVSVAIFVAVGIGAYMLGYHRAQKALRAEYEALVLKSDSVYRPSDPLQDGGGAAERLVPGPASSGNPDERAGGGGSESPRTVPRSAASGGDPREVGYYYLTLIQAPLSGAERIAKICRDEGLDAHAVVGDNGRLARVIVLPGFASRDDAKLDQLKRSVREVGSRIRSQYPGESDFADCYASLFTG